MKRNSAKDMMNLKGKRPIVCLTAYTAPIARALDEHVDLLLVRQQILTLQLMMLMHK